MAESGVSFQTKLINDFNLIYIVRETRYITSYAQKGWLIDVRDVVTLFCSPNVHTLYTAGHATLDQWRTLLYLPTLLLLHLESDTDFLNGSIHTRWAFVIVQAAEWSRHPRFHYVRYKMSSLIYWYVTYYLLYNIRTDSQKHPTYEDVFILSVGHVFRKEHTAEDDVDSCRLGV